MLPVLIRVEAAADRRLIGPLAVATCEHRAAIFAALAALESDRGLPPVLAALSPESFVEWLLSAPPSEIVTAIHGDVPELPAAVARIGCDPLEDPGDYARLAGLLSGQDSRACLQAQCLLQAAQISSRLLRILDRLRETYLRPGVVSAIRTPEIADRIEQITDFLLQSCSQLTEQDLAQSLEAGALFNVHDWTSRMLLWHGDVLCDLPDDGDFSFLRSARAFGTCAECYGPDLASPSSGKIMNAALGVAAFAEWKHAPVLVELVRMSDGIDAFWICQDLRGPDGAPVSDRLTRDIRTFLSRRGIRSLAVTHRPGLGFDLVERLAHVEPVTLLRVCEAA
ncbi:hypothetical protein [Cereibacter sphaeroides]|uniref:hypothetical protein n=1 Tax=Cereibacter sphaeroides TaxID=1063 RepID=UPI001F24DEDC|nr:hypothetical protein [Cereibacter sphaeroides]MCE6967451.1 hypothetical protein [Cereibacter sphaeroides]